MALKPFTRFAAVSLIVGAVAAGVATHATGLQAPRENSAPVGQRTHVLLPSRIPPEDRVQTDGSGGEAAQSAGLVSAGLTITPTFDTSITSDPNAAAIESTINNAIAIFESQFSDPITVNIKFAKRTDGLGLSSVVFYTIPYATFLSALKADAHTADDITATSLLPSAATNPVNGAATINVKSANLKALGVAVSPPADGFDGTITVNMTVTSPGSPGSTLDYNLQTVVLHEIDEVLGLGSALPDILNGTIFPEDLYRYSSANTRSFTATDSRMSGVFAYFSIDGTFPPRAEFDNQNDGGDFGDWQSNPLRTGVSPKVQDAYGTPGANPLPGVELAALDVIGYDRVANALAAPLVTANPANLTVSAGQLATFTAGASGVPTPGVQWQVSSGGAFADINGAISTTYSFSTTLADNGKVFRAVFTNAFGSVTSASAMLTVNPGVALPTMTLDRTSLVFAGVNNGLAFTAVTSAQTVRLTQSGAGTVTWMATPSQPWIHVSPANGTGSATLTVTTVFQAGLAPTQAGTITIALAGAANAVGPINVTLNSLLPGIVTPPFGSFDTPTNGVTGVAGSIAVTGWTLDVVGVSRVTICRDAFGGEVAPVDPNCAGNAKIYIGDAVFIDGARPDVQGVNPTVPLSSRAGWGYLLLTNFLPGLGNGTFNLRAYALNVAGLWTALGVKTITCSNAASLAPFGAIDVPGQGAVVSGTIGNVGWVLSPGSARSDPPGGGVVHVFVDGVDQGPANPGLWNARPDLQALFPVSQFSGVNTALGVHSLNTTTLTNGVHTIFWLATGTGLTGTSGIGSRFFTVSNGADVLAPNAVASGQRAGTTIAARAGMDIPSAGVHNVSAQTLDAEIAAAPLDSRPVLGRRGFDLDRPLQTYPSNGGPIDVQAEELDRIELHLSDSAANQYAGYLRTSAGLRPLPIGSALDAPTGTFTWAPGVGFYGSYDLTFVRWNGEHAIARQDLRITLNAKGSNRIGPQTIIDVPTNGTSVGSSFVIGGWAADLDSTVDSGVNTVHVWAYPIDERGKALEPLFIGPAIYGGARPDVGAVYGDRFTNSGYGIIVNTLPPGTYDIAVFAYSTVENTFTAAKVVRVLVRAEGLSRFEQRLQPR